MLKLKRVEIHGFKSFYDRTEMKFKGQGIAAVVGPNGCGKSNLSDAINWVLGEQSAKSLRGARMEDVIFAGTRERKPLGMASVTMTLVADEFGLRPKLSSESPNAPSADVAAGQHPNGDGPDSHEHRNGFSHHADTEAHSRSDVSVPDRTGAERTAERAGEITIMRRLYRSGESEYLINGKTARLRDIQDLFLGTGLGPESYAIIEQGRIGQILSNKPQDRRAVIEEAAGITKFKTRKRLAEAKLEGAKQNLSRVFDILEEVNRQVTTLKRQAAKAKRYGELRTEMIGYLKQVLAGKYQLLERESAKTAIELNLTSAELQALQAAVSSQEEQQTAVIENSYAVDQELTEARGQLSALQVESERSRTRLEYQLKQIEAIDGRLSSTEAEATALETQGCELSAELEGLGGELGLLEEQRAAAREALNEKAAERQDAQSRLTEREGTLEASRQQLMRLLSEASTLKNRLSQTEAQLTGLDRETNRARAEEQQSLSDLERMQRVKEELSQRLSARQAELTTITDQRRDVEQSLQSKRAALHGTRQMVDRLRSEHSRIKARRDSLDEVISHRSYTTETVKRLFTAIAQGQENALNPVGVLADFLEVDPQYEKAAEEFLHEELEYVVVRDWQDAERGIELLRNGIDGRATFLVENFEDVSAHQNQPAGPSSQDGLVGRLADALRFSNGLSSAPINLLPRVAHCYLASDRESAQRLARQFPELWFLAPDGISYHGHSVTGGKKTGAGPLALKRELREVSQLEKTRQQELTSAQTLLADLEREIADLSEHLEVLRQQQQSHEKDVLALDHETRKLAEEFQRANARLSGARLELDRIDQERGKLEDLLVTVSGELEAKETARFDQEQALEQAREELGELQAAAARLTEEHSTLRANLASFEERHRAVTSAKARLDSGLAEIMNRLQRLAADGEGLAAEREQLLASNSELEGRGRELKEDIASFGETVQQLDAKEAELRRQIANAEESLKAFRQNAQTLQETRSTLQVAMARLESDLKHLEETSRNELQISVQELSAAIETVPSEVEAAELESKYSDVRRKIEALGPVNPQALEEYEESQQRQEFLNAQRQDLLDSIRDTEKAIHEIDVESRKRFTEAFHAINGNFSEMFKTLFSGGLAEMRLTDEENVSESGIDIVASPPGKRLQSVLLLSGGEKALTAMALLMAVFQYTPSPFCILDEVDAPLDEPNIQRLTRLLASMSQQTQFIVITHAKRTMEAAQSLYGVTMQEPGISRLVSVKFKPAEEVDSISAGEAKERERELILA